MAYIRGISSSLVRYYAVFASHYANYFSQLAIILILAKITLIAIDAIYRRSVSSVLHLLTDYRSLKKLVIQKEIKGSSGLKDQRSARFLLLIKRVKRHGITRSVRV